MSQSPTTVIVTEPEYRKGEAIFTAAKKLKCIPGPPEESELANAIRSAHARHAIVGVNPYRDVLYSALPPGAVLARFGVGHDGIDKSKGTQAGVYCTNTPGALDRSVAEHTLSLIAAASRQLVSVASAMQANNWAPQSGSEMGGKTLAVIGCGPIGRKVARIASAGFQMRVVGCRRSSGSNEELRAFGFEKVVNNFTEAVREADYVSLHIPAIPANARFINAARLGQLRASAWLINTARGAVVDETALFDAVSSGHLGGAALDVFEREPYQPVDDGRDLRTLKNVILTPHVGSNTAQANRRMAERALQNIAWCEAGDFKKMDLLNPDVLPA